MKRSNPRKRPATMADVERAKKQATGQAMINTIYLILYVLIDKHGASMEEIQTLAQELNYMADSVANGYVSWKDIEHTVKEEYGIYLPWEL